MGNVLKTPTLGAVTPNFPHVLTDQIVDKPSKPKPNKQAATTITEDNSKFIYYGIIAVALIYFLKRG